MFVANSKAEADGEPPHTTQSWRRLSNEKQRKDIAQQDATEQDGTQFSAGCLDHILIMKDDEHGCHKDSGNNPRTGEEKDDDSPRTGWCEEGKGNGYACTFLYVRHVHLVTLVALLTRTGGVFSKAGLALPATLVLVGHTLWLMSNSIR